MSEHSGLCAGGGLRTEVSSISEAARCDNPDMAERCGNDGTRWFQKGLAPGDHGFAAATGAIFRLRRRLTGWATPPALYVAEATAGTSGTCAEQTRSPAP